MAGGEILLAGDVLIYDDLIDEALEYFAVTLTFQDPDNVPPLASIESVCKLRKHNNADYISP